ncbi:hypothetical protein [Novosphingobium sp. 9]|uniref:hypothetical protein n=1 Tax=Novosphingobium sp. 9 TaxID=2025349 RepID=UPI0021B556EA|nr:hypothetical protein [Novosphingobium sp. 9]
MLHALLLGALTVAVVETGQRQDDALYLVPTVERVSAIVHALETVPPPARGEVVAALNNDRQDVRLIAALPPPAASLQPSPRKCAVMRKRWRGARSAFARRGGSPMAGWTRRTAFRPRRSMSPWHCMAAVRWRSSVPQSSGWRRS